MRPPSFSLLPLIPRHSQSLSHVWPTRRWGKLLLAIKRGESKCAQTSDVVGSCRNHKHFFYRLVYSPRGSRGLERSRHSFCWTNRVGDAAAAHSCAGRSMHKPRYPGLNFRKFRSSMRLDHKEVHTQHSRTRYRIGLTANRRTFSPSFHPTSRCSSLEIQPS